MIILWASKFKGPRALVQFLQLELNPELQLWSLNQEDVANPGVGIEVDRTQGAMTEQILEERRVRFRRRSRIYIEFMMKKLDLNVGARAEIVTGQALDPRMEPGQCLMDQDLAGELQQEWGLDQENLSEL